ncbi:MAG: ABC transporter substrate-binding protein [Actinobacteria bacterium]|nr:ABC transporter substrate-binding protein [Thermoleophilia bacterium]MCB9010332.1 ABC transporter substrate-binding protein [Actinomycetota bacterium]
MIRSLRWALILIVASVLAIAGCGGGDRGAGGAAVDVRDWASVEAVARGTTVNWYVWGGSDAINAFIDTTYGEALRTRYGIVLNRVPVADTVDAVNRVLSEKQAGTDPGVVDLIWINGENFATLRDARMLRTGWARALPNARLVDWGDPAISRDFGVPVGGMESPWSSAQLQLITHPDRVPTADLPRSYAEFARWACAHPGRATYIQPGPGGFTGTRFVKGALYELSGGARQWGTYDPARFARFAPRLERYLTDLAPCLWREGRTYPRDENALHKLFANNEVDFTLSQATSGPETLVEAGTIPRGSRAFVFDHNMIGDHNYVAIPRNAPNPAAALVLANLLLEPEFQARHSLPESGFGLGIAIDPTRVTPGARRRVLAEAAAARGDGATPILDLQRSRAPDTAPEYQDAVEQLWRERVLGAR